MRKLMLTMALAALAVIPAAATDAASPLPAFDKEAVTTHPYNRMGEQDVAVDKNAVSENVHYRPGNTGTEQEPAFFVKKINLTGFELPDELGKLQDLLSKYENRSLKQVDLNELMDKVTEYAHTAGFTVAQAIVPRQEIANGQLELKVYVAKYDQITLGENKTKVADRVLAKYPDPLHSGDVITDKKLENVLNYMNDLPGVIARGVLSPGSEAGTTNLLIETERRPVWNNYVYVDNGGSRASGRYRYGFRTEIKNPGQQGDKFTLAGYISNNETKNYSLTYDIPVGTRGTRWGVGYSRSTYDLDGYAIYEPTGKSSSWSFYGLTPIYRDKAKRVYAIYGYDYRQIKDSLRYLGQKFTWGDKDANVLHAGVTVSEYEPNRFTNGNIIYWYGDLHTKDQVNYRDGAYHKLTADFRHVRYWKKWNARVEAHGQIANRDLDGSERFYVGGLNGVRAYPASETSGDNGYNASFELRHATDTKGLEIAAFLDAGEVTRNKSGDDHRNLAGWGLGLVYEKPNDWYARLDWARKIHPQQNESDTKQSNNRLWFQIYKMF